MYDDKETTIAELKEYIGIICNERWWNHFHNPKDLSRRIYEEAVEILECFKDPCGSDKLPNEIADITFNVLRYFQKYGVDLASTLHGITDESITGTDNETNIAQLKSSVAQSCGNDYWFRDQYYAARAIIEESEMFVNYFSTMSESESETPFLKREISVYLADIFAKILGLADRSGINLPEAFYSKMEKNKKKYSADKSRGTALKYTML